MYVLQPRDLSQGFENHFFKNKSSKKIDFCLLISMEGQKPNLDKC
jgi:hypothetical protein